MRVTIGTLFFVDVVEVRPVRAIGAIFTTGFLFYDFRVGWLLLDTNDLLPRAGLNLLCDIRVDLPATLTCIIDDSPKFSFVEIVDGFDYILRQ